MKGFGETFFGGSRFIFWSLGPLILATSIFLTLSIHIKDASRLYFVIAVDIFAIFVLLSLYDPVRFQFSTRVVTGCVFLIYAHYFIETHFVENIPIVPSWSGVNPFRAALGVLIIGVPSLLHTVTGYFTPVNSSCEITDRTSS